MICNNCGSNVPEGTKFCTKCGSPMYAAPAVEPAQPVQPTQSAQPAFTAPQQPAPKKNNTKLIIIIVAAVIAVIGIAVGVLFATGVIGGSDKKKDDKKTTESTTESTTASTTVEPSESTSAQPTYDDSTTLPDGYTKFYHIGLKVPDGYNVNDAAAYYIITSVDYPQVSDNIVVTEAKGNVNDYSREALEAELKSALNGFQGIDYYDKFTEDGHDVIAYSYDFTMNGIEMSGLQYCIFIDGYCDSITYTIVSGEYSDEFIEIANSFIFL